MSTRLFYFSGTGNSLAVAKHLAAELGDTQVIPMAKALNKPVTAGPDAVGLVFPVYMWGVPLLVADFARNLTGGGGYVFAVATYGGYIAGTLGMLERLLKERGIKLTAGFGIKMPGNYVPMYDIIAPEKQGKLFGKEKERIGVIARAVKGRQVGIVDRGLPLVNWLLSDRFYNLSAPRIPGSDKALRADDNCTRCGTCYRVCPVENIKLVDGKPSWLGHCQDCLACLHWCPASAIQFKYKTTARKRYHHPDVAVEEMFCR
jgi:ferredoxin/flavodoxin